MLPPWVEKYIGIPFKEHGRDLAIDGGLDCWGLIRVVKHEREGILLDSLVDGYASTHPRDVASMAAVIEAEAAAHWTPVPDWQEEPGDVGTFRVAGRPMHVGLVLGRGWMLHIEDGIDSCVEKYRGAKWRDRITGFYRHAKRSG